MKYSFLNLLVFGSSAISVAALIPPLVAVRQETDLPTSTGIGGLINCIGQGRECTASSNSFTATAPSSTSSVNSFTSNEGCSTSISSPTGTSTITATTSATPKPPPQTMALKRDWRIDAGKFENLKAEKKCKMMYTHPDVEIGNKPTRKTPIAWVTMPEMKYPAIQLYNTDKVSKVQCLGPKSSPQKITMQFNNWEAYLYAWNNWHNEVRPKDGDYLVITDAPGCWEGADAGQERSFLRATTEERDNRTMSISCNVEPIPFSETVPPESGNDIEFGEFTPGNSARGLNVTGDAPFTGGGGAPESRQGPLTDKSGDSDFDQKFDDRIGRINQQSLANSTLGRSGFTLDDFYGESGLEDLAMENLNQNLRKRRIGDRIKKAVKKVAAAVQKAVAVVKDAVVTAANKIVEVAKKVGEALNDFFTFDKSFSKNASFDTTSKTNTAVTPFNGAKGIKLLSFDQESELKGVSIKASADIFCVECGFEGEFVIAGALRFSIANGMEKAEITMQGNMEAAFSLGLVGSLDASVETSTQLANITSEDFKPKPTSKKEFDQRILSLSLSDFLLPGILDIGPIASLDVGVDLGLAARGKLLAGVVFSWLAIDAKIDLKDSKQNKADGFGPTVTPIFEADGQFTVTAGTFLAFKLSLGVSILNGKFDFTAGVQMKPRVEVNATVALTADLSGVSLATTSDGCHGIGIGVGSSIEIAFVLFEDLPFEQTIPIKTIDGPSFDECINIKAKRSISRRQTFNPSFPAPPSTLGNTTLVDGLLTSMASPDNTVRLRWSPNGNTYAIPESKVPADLKGKEWSGWFASDSTGSLIFGDSHGRIFHGYLDTIQKMGVSRLRLHGAAEIPQSAWPVMFAATIPDTENITTVATQNPTMIISDVEGNIYFPIICIYESEKVFPKVFMANTTDTGIESLMSNSDEMLTSVTGEKVGECGFMPWTNFRTGEDIGTVSGA